MVLTSAATSGVQSLRDLGRPLDRPHPTWAVGFACPLVVACIVAGCQAPPRVKPSLPGVTATPAGGASTEQITRDPVAFLRQVKQRCDAIPKYRLTFYRQERLGVLQTLGRIEKIGVTFRADPFAVRFVWEDPGSPFVESLYVAGENDDKLLVRERRGFLGLPPTTYSLDPTSPVKLGQAKRPITDFGLSKLMARTTGTIDSPPGGVPARIEYRGLTRLEQTRQEAHHLVIMRAVAPGHPHPRQDLWIDAKTGLPAGTALYLADGRMDGLYLYADVRPDDSISDKDFRMTAAQPTSARSGGAGGADRASRR